MKEKGKHLTVYSLHYFFLFAAVAVLFPFFPLLLQSKGLSLPQIGFLMGSYELTGIIGLMIMGHFFDRLQSPRRSIIAIGLVGITFLYLIARTENPLPLALLTLGLGFAVKSPTSLTDALYGQTMRHPQDSYGKARVWGSLGFIAAAGLIQLTGLVEGSRPVSVFTGYALFLALALLTTSALPTEQLHRKSDQKHLPFRQAVRSFPGIYWTGLCIAFLSSLGLSGHFTFFSLLLKNRFDTPEVGGFWAIGSVLELPLFYFSGYLLRKFSLKKLWLICLTAGILRMQVYSLSTTLLPLYLVQVTHSLIFALNHLCIMTLITQATSPASRGLAMSLYSAIGMGLSLFAGGILGGLVLKAGDFPLLYQIFSLFPFLGACIALFFLKGHRELTQTERSS